MEYRQGLAVDERGRAAVTGHLTGDDPAASSMPPVSADR
jgi:hypothetical protein